MQRTFVTTLPEKLQEHQAVVDLPRYGKQLLRAFLRSTATDAGVFDSDDHSIDVITTVAQIKKFADELFTADPQMDIRARVPFTNYVGLQFTTTGEAVQWARGFVRRHYPDVEERQLKRTLLALPLSKTEIIWLGGEEFLSIIESIAARPSAEEVMEHVPAQQQPLTTESAAQKRAEIAARKAAKKEAKQSKEAAVDDLFD